MNNSNICFCPLADLHFVATLQLIQNRFSFLWVLGTVSLVDVMPTMIITSRTFILTRPALQSQDATGQFAP